MKAKMMFKTMLLLVSCLTVLSVVQPASAQSYTGNTSGVIDTRLWTIYTKPGSTATKVPTITPGANGKYSGSWNTFKGNFTMGVGWSGDNSPTYTSPVKVNDINYVGYNIGSYSDDKKGTVSVYGKVNSNSTNPEVEFYIVERWISASALPGEGTKMASNVTIGGASYDIWKVPKAGFVQYWSVRTSQAPLGTNVVVPVSDHFKKWEELKMYTSKSRRFLYLSTESLSQLGGTSTGSVGATVWGW